MKESAPSIGVADLPDVSNVVAGIGHASDRPATLHGVVFDILVGSENRVELRRGKSFMLLRQSATH
jgi:hypothetical protein